MIQKRLESRPVALDNHVRAVGRSSVIATCPWCGGRTVIYLWSFAGAGKKKCPCGVLFVNGKSVTSEKLVEVPGS